MKIDRVVIAGESADFGMHTLVTSRHNSSGKTTFLRLILFSLGWNIPSTKGINFDELNTSIIFHTDDNAQFTFERYKRSITVYKEEKIFGEYSVKSDLPTLLSIYTGITQPQLLNNLLGTFYFDQEKGWTLLNRGVTIGSNHFQIESFLEGLIGADQSELRKQLKDNSRKIDGYEVLRKTLEYQNTLKEDESKLDWDSFDDMNAKYREIDLDIRRLTKQIESLRKSLKDNKRFLEMIDGFGLRAVTESGEELVISKDNIIGFDDNQELIKARMSVLNRKYDYLLKDRMDVKKSLSEQSQLFNAQSQLDRFNASVTKLNMDVTTIDSVIDNIKKDNKQIKDHIKDQLKTGDYANELYELIVKFSKFLKIDNYLAKSKDFIFTSDLKKYSGAILHLLVFAFRMAYLHLLQEKTQRYYPIIIDSPFGKEITEQNVSLMYDLLSRYFPNNQIITASIEDISKFTDVDQFISFEGTMLDSLKRNE